MRAQFLDHGCTVGCTIAVQDLRSTSALLTFDVDQILDRDRNSPQRQSHVRFFCFRRRGREIMHQVRADFGTNSVDSLLQGLQRLTWRNFPSPEKIPKLDDAKRRQIALRHSSRCLTESLKPTSWSRSLRFSSGERTRLACPFRRLAEMLLLFNQRKSLARRQRQHARARALPGKEVSRGDHPNTERSERRVANTGQLRHSTTLVTMKRLLAFRGALLSASAAVNQSRALSSRKTLKIGTACAAASTPSTFTSFNFPAQSPALEK